MNSTGVEGQAPELGLEWEGSVGDFLNKIRYSSENTTRKGEALELLFREIAKSDPALDVAEIDLYSNWAKERGDSHFTTQDRGVDLVAKLNSGEYVGIQCKFYERSILKQDIDSFLGKLATRDEKGRPFFSLGWIVSTAKLSPGVQQDLDSHICDIRTVPIWDYRDQMLKTGSLFDKRNTRPYQDEAIKKVERAFKNSDSGKLIMACGTGKTLTALRAMEKVVPENGRVLFCTPTIALVSQVRAQWLRQANSSIDARVVCSDAGAGKTSRPKGAPLLAIQELECPVTNDPERLAEFLKKDTPNRIKVVFTTYQSLKHIKKAQGDETVPEFDLVVADEAHKTTGSTMSKVRKANGASADETHTASGSVSQGDMEGETVSGFRMIHNKKDIRANKRLYMTATPRVYSNTKALRTKGYKVTDMNDTDVYGNTIYQYNFKQAVEEGYLCDYRLIMLRVHEDILTPRLIEKVRKGSVSNDEMTRLFGTMLAIRGNSHAGEDNTRTGILHRTIAFANTRARSKWYSETINSKEMKSAVTVQEKNISEDDSYFGAGMEIECKHLDSDDQVVERIRALHKLQDAKKNNKAEILTNVGIFSEGVDVPSLNAVAFLDPRRSKIDILQAVGRVMRLPENPDDKRIGYVIVPVVVPDGTDLLEDLASADDRYAPVLDVIAALQSNDESFIEALENKLVIQEVSLPNNQPPNGNTENGYGSTPELPKPDENTKQGIVSYIVSRTGLTREAKGKITADGIKSQVSKEADKMLESEIGSDLCGLLGISEHENDKKEACTLAALLMLNALFVHRRLQGTELLPEGNELDTITHSTDPSHALLGSWDIILAKDYRPIFEPAIPVLKELKKRPLLCQRVLKGLIECADRFGPSLSEMGWDHAGPLYHSVLGTAKSDGAFYTNNISALILARLAVHDGMTDWKDRKSISDLRIMDPACGTGTLLMAVLRELKRRAEKANPHVDLMALHKDLVENSLAGLDINRQATQLAASNLTISSENVDYDSMNIYTMKHGIQATDSEPKLGSIEILDTKGDDDIPLKKLTQQDLLLEDRVRERTLPAVEAKRSVGNADDLEEDSFPVKNLDIIILNPPYTNAADRDSRLSATDRKKIKDREKNIQSIIEGKDPSLEGVTNYNSIATFFTPLADILVGKEAGTMATVLPAAACIGSVGLQERRWRAKNWHVEKIVSNHDPKKFMFSENTDMHEVLLVCRRAANTPPPSYTEHISLRERPSDEKEAHECIDAILGDSKDKRDRWFTHAQIAISRIADGDWRFVQWHQPELEQIVQMLESHASLVSLDKLSRIGPTGRQTRGAWEKCDPSEVITKSFYSKSTDYRQTIKDEAEQPVKPRKGQILEWTRETGMASRLLVTTGSNTVSGRVMAIYSTIPAFGSGWQPVLMEDESTEPAMAGWLNSTPGRLLYLNRRTRVLFFPQYSKEDISTIPVPRSPWPLDNAVRSCWEQIVKRGDGGDNCSVRCTLDKAAAEVLGISYDEVSKWRRLLAQEPTVSGKAIQVQTKQASQDAD